MAAQFNLLASCVVILLCLPVVASQPLTCPPPEDHKISFLVDVSGRPTDVISTGYYPHGNANISGNGVFTFDLRDNMMNWTINMDYSKGAEEFVITQAHIYNMRLDKTGDSWACWGGRWSKHEFLQGINFDTYIDVAKLFDDSDKTPVTDWTLILHSEGGHFATDAEGNLIVYDANVHEVSVTGVKESGERYNNRMPRKLTDRRLREYNPNSGGYGSPTCCDGVCFDDVYPADQSYWDRQHDKPFPDENGQKWIYYSDIYEIYLPTEYAVERGLTVEQIENTEYLFYLYDDQGPEWDYGGPEGVAGGSLIPCVYTPSPSGSPTVSSVPSAEATTSSPSEGTPEISQVLTPTPSPTVIRGLVPTSTAGRQHCFWSFQNMVVSLVAVTSLCWF